MNSRLVLFLGLALAVVVSQVSASSHSKKTCNCGLSSGGINACSCQQVLVRPPKPQKLHITGGPKVICTKVSGPSKLNPIGDLCTCGRNYVQPAHVPKQHCPVCQNRGESSYYNGEESDISGNALPLPYYSQRHGGASSSSSYAYEESQYEQHLADQYEEETGDYFSNNVPMHPADAVSLTLAYEQARRQGKAVREEGLNFGPRTIPKDGYISKTQDDIPEDRLYSFDKQVVELRFPKGPRGCSRAALEEEAEDALLAAQEEEGLDDDGNIGNHGAYLSYADLGYAPETHKQHEFVPGHSGFAYEDAAFPYGQETFTMPLRKPCGLKPGSVIVPDEEQYYEEQESSEYGSSEEEEGVSGYQIISTGGGQSYEQESYHQQHHPSFFGKLMHAAKGY